MKCHPWHDSLSDRHTFLLGIYNGTNLFSNFCRYYLTCQQVCVLRRPVGLLRNVRHFSPARANVRENCYRIARGESPPSPSPDLHFRSSPFVVILLNSRPSGDYRPWFSRRRPDGFFLGMIHRRLIERRTSIHPVRGHRFARRRLIPSINLTTPRVCWFSCCPPYFVLIRTT